MHQEVDPGESLTPAQKLIRQRNAIMSAYRAATQHAVRALDYYQRFSRVEDWSEDDTQDYITVLQNDSRRGLREIAVEVRRLRNRLDIINNKILDEVKKEKEKDDAARRKST